MLKKMTLHDLVAPGNPLISLVEQVARSKATVNEYGIYIDSPRINEKQLVDVYGGVLPEAPEQVLLILQQRTVAQMIERQLNHRAAARSVSGLAAVLAHEIKNPLSGIKGAAQLLESSVGDEDRTLTQLICNETDRICKLVDRMEVFGDERPVAMQPVNIHDVLNHVKIIATNGFGQNITIIENYDPSLPPVSGNRDKLIQVFLNLLKNACEAIGPNATDGKITLTTAFRPGIRLSVPGSKRRISLPLDILIEDNGPGIPDELRPHLFDPFVTTKKNGSGLGLALVAKIIGDHGGIVECDSRPRQTIFRMLMPMYEQQWNRDAGGKDTMIDEVSTKHH
jgi:two-component system nitrogen regulation sensor histidine kinase GlnL